MLLLLATTSFAGPWCGTPARLAANPMQSRPVAAPRPPSASRAVCIDPQDLAGEQGLRGATFDQTRQTEHFLVAWDAANAVLDAAAVDAWVDAFERSWEVEVDELGWRAPDQTQSCLITVLVADLPDSWSGTGGWTDVQETGGVPFIIVNTDWQDEEGVWRDTLVAHEFNHASQFGYGVFWDESDWWYWEATAEWSSDLVYDDADTYTWSLWSYMDAPWLALDSQELLVDYGHFAFNVTLEEGYGEGTVLAAWQAATPQTSVPDVIAEVTGSLDDAVLAYTAKVASFDVEEWEVWEAAMDELAFDPYVQSVTSYPASGAVEGREAPQERGQNFLHLTGTPGGDVRFAFSGAADVDGVATRWGLTVSTVDAAGMRAHSVREVDPEAEVVIEGLGEGVTDVFVGVVPLGDIGTSGASWSWEATVEESAGGDDTGRPRKEDAEEEPAGCGCATGGGAPLLLGLLAMLGVRRRG